MKVTKTIKCFPLGDSEAKCQTEVHKYVSCDLLQLSYTYCSVLLKAGAGLPHGAWLLSNSRELCQKHRTTVEREHDFY